MCDKNLLFIVNPISGRMKAKSVLFEILELFCNAGYRVAIQITRCKGHAEELAAAAAMDGYNLAVCCGGDGTLNEVVHGMMQAKDKIPIGYIPAGTTNDFAGSAGIPHNMTVAAKAIIKGSRKPFDIGGFNDSHYFTYIASFGAFTAASYNAPQTTKNFLGHLAYVLEGIKDIGSLQAVKLRTEANNTIYEGDYIFGAVTNTTSIGGIVKLGSDIVDMNDGRFELLLIKAPKSLLDLHKIILSLTSSDFNNDKMDFFQAESVSFTMPEGVEWSLDGEHVSGTPHTVIRNIHNAVEFIL